MLNKYPGILQKCYWRLPYETRRIIFSKVYPNLYARYQKLREPQALKYHRDIHTFIKNKCIFIHIPKTAGVAVTNSLFGRATGGHTPLAQYAIILSKKEFESFFKFTLVRNPWDRLVSAYLYLKQGGRNKYDKAWAEKHLSPYRDFETFVLEWVNKTNILKGVHFMPQYTFLTLPGKRYPEMDFIGRYENLIEDYNQIRNILGFGEQLILYNKTQNKNSDYRTYFNNKMTEIVYNTYIDDIELFGYNFD